MRYLTVDVDYIRKIQISETDFFLEREANFKHGSKFKGWIDCEDSDECYRPFTLFGRYRELIW